MTAQASPPSLSVPELGPALGRLVAPPAPPAGTPPHWIPLDDIRLTLVTELFELAGDARRWLREGDRDLALAALHRDGWARAWEKAVEAVAARAARGIEARLEAAAREARVPARRRRQLRLEPAEIRSLNARLRKESAAFYRALDRLEAATHGVRVRHPVPEARAAWEEALLTAARRLEAAWLALEAELGREWVAWEAEVQAVQAWRRPVWPLWVAGLVLGGLALWAGLMLGGYLPVPQPLQGLAEAVWERWN
ncbi:MAG TPA: hypothetical protein VNJ71_08110 [Gemmatimonadales bacterium]|nr:hypothetical protein [Gemmatimonadales bacterium]